MKTKKQKPFKRGAGILLPVASLPSLYGIGSFGKEARKFVDFLTSAKQKYWQVLPLGPTSYGDSPYQSFSAFAGNPYYIDLELLKEEKLLTKKELEAEAACFDSAKIDYAKIYETRFKTLKKAYSRFSPDKDYEKFCGEQGFWLSDYALFMALKERFNGASWQEWEEDVRMRRKKSVASYEKLLKDETGFWKFCQYEFFTQWHDLKKYANEKGVEIIGDIPIYAALDSADVWASGDLFQLDKRRRPTRVAGVPPDLFSATGQLWGNPLYDWDEMERQDFLWWKNRIRQCADLYDIIRIDHFVGIAHYYSIPAGDNTAENGVWIEGPKRKLLKAIREVAGAKKIIAEDLGEGTPEMFRMMKEYGYPGMKLMEFAFDSGSDSCYLPHNFEKNCIVYGGTHDNEPLAGYFSHQKRSVVRYAKDYLNVRKCSDITNGIIRAAYMSIADTVIFQMQDILKLGSESRTNTPSVLGGNWEWKLPDGVLTKELSDELSRLTEIYGRA